MPGEIDAHYDVIVMGGGPGGSTLGSQLARTTDLSIAIFEKANFPREHIGESLAHPTTTALEEIGALRKVMDSDFVVQKFGGIFHWDGKAPAAGFFDHAAFEEDGAYRFAYHVNRSDFDDLLLRHAEEQGVHVFEGISVSAFTKVDDGCEITLADGRKVHGTFFVDASGRRNSITSPQKRAYLSGYKNIALWQHFTGCRDAPSIDEKWNVFHDTNKSAIVCSAFEDGWCWYIPVIKQVDGERVATHSVGIVTNPEILKEPGKEFTDPLVFRRALDTVPLIKDLLDDAAPISDKVSTATNYSMINDEFVNFDERWILVGDAAYFVDPLFSSGVAFAMHHGLSAALLIKTALNPAIPDQMKRDMWSDYNRGWHGIAESFSLSIDQWYHAIGEYYPESIYWRSRGTTIDLGLREETFQVLLSTAMTPDLLRLMTRETNQQADLDQAGPYMRAVRLADPGELRDGDVVRVSEGAQVRESLTINLPGFKAALPDDVFGTPDEYREAVVRYWADPVTEGKVVDSLLREPVPCHRFTSPDQQVDLPSFAEIDGGIEVWRALANGPRTVRDLRDQLGVNQLLFLKLMIRSGIVEVEPASSTGG